MLSKKNFKSKSDRPLMKLKLSQKPKVKNSLMPHLIMRNCTTAGRWSLITHLKMKRKRKCKHLLPKRKLSLLPWSDLALKIPESRLQSVHRRQVKE